MANTETDSITTLKARIVFPIIAPPVYDGSVIVQGKRILSVGKQPGRGKILDLGEVAILPGFVNAHAHLEFSDLPQPLGQPGIEFVDWVRLLMRDRKPAADSREGVERGLDESRQWGTTTLGEIAQPNWSAEAFEAAELAGEVFLELIAPTPDRVDAAFDSARQHVCTPPVGGWHSGLSPHAPYSVHPTLLRHVVDLSAARRVSIAMHLAETQDELILLQSARGPLRDFLEELGAWEPSAFPGNKRPMDYLQVLSRAHRVLVVHGNYLNDEEMLFLAENASKMSAVYCPRSHAHFKHGPYPLAKMLARGVTVALGTDSRASSPDLSILGEMRHVARTHTDLKGEVILSLGTLFGARALGRDHEVGSLERHKLADLAIVALPDRESSDPHELVLDSDLPTVARCWRGVVRPCS